MKRFYITGVSGTGKSSVLEKLKEKNIPVIDIDVRENRITHWRNNKTKEISHWESGIGQDFFDNHSYTCEIEQLINLMDGYKEKELVVVCGLADNQSEFLHLFDKVFLFQCSEETFIKRIMERTSHDFGKHDSEQKMILGWYEDYEKEMLNAGAIPINTEKSLDQVVEEVIRDINS